VTSAGHNFCNTLAASTSGVAERHRPCHSKQQPSGPEFPQNSAAQQAVATSTWQTQISHCLPSTTAAGPKGWLEIGTRAMRDPATQAACIGASPAAKQHHWQLRLRRSNRCARDTTNITTCQS
jgi:hypothetical protein